MRSPLMVPLVLLTLLLLLIGGNAALKPNASHKSGKVCANKRTIEAAESRGVSVNTNEQADEMVTQDETRVPQIFPEDASRIPRSIPEDDSRVPRMFPEDGSTVPDEAPRIKDEKVLQAIESNLLSLFGLKSRPRPNRNVVIPQAMKDLYRLQTGLDIDTPNFALPGSHTKTANTVRTFLHKESPVDQQFRHHHRFRLSFAMDTVPKSEKLQAAELHLNATGSHHILVHDIVQPGIRGQSQPSMRLIDSRTVQAKDGRISLDVTPAVRRWLANPQDNHGLLVVVQKSEGHVRLKRSVEKEEEWREAQPVLMTFTDDGKPKSSKSMEKRARRGTKKKTKGSDNCRRHEMYVNFQEVGWNDWIVAPHGYDAYFCAGECPFPLADHLNSTNHAIVQSLIHKKIPAIPKACCVPTKLVSISMLYVGDNDAVVLKNYQDMMVDSCGCR